MQKYVDLDGLQTFKEKLEENFPAGILDSDTTVDRAIKDSSGNVISDTYVTKTALSAGLNSKLDSDAKAVSAATADKLSTARSLKVSLSSTSALNFCRQRYT